jgi:hypothetical protein
MSFLLLNIRASFHLLMLILVTEDIRPLLHLIVWWLQPSE